MSVHQPRAFLLLRIYRPAPTPIYSPSLYLPSKAPLIFSIKLPQLPTVSIVSSLTGLWGLQEQSTYCFRVSVIVLTLSQIGKRRPETVLVDQATYQSPQHIWIILTPVTGIFLTSYLRLPPQLCPLPCRVPVAFVQWFPRPPSGLS